MRKYQIGVIGSAEDLKYSTQAREFAKKLGAKIAEKDYILVFGPEKDYDSLPTVAAKSAHENGGFSLGITYDKGLDIFVPDSASAVVATGSIRGGGRETSLMLSCDGVIAIAGGSGTLNEICVAYQANIPVAVVDIFDGWAKKLSGEFLDDRKRYKFEPVRTPDEAVDKIVSLIKERK